MAQAVTMNLNIETQPVFCPICGARLLDAISPYTEVFVSRYSGALRMKCHKCKCQIGIEVKPAKPEQPA